MHNRVSLEPRRLSNFQFTTMASTTVCPSNYKLPLLYFLLLLFSLLFSHCSASGGFCNPNDKKALLQIAKDLSLNDWDPKTTPDCCNFWFGVGCNSDGRVTSFGYNLFASSVQVAQRIPASIAGLPYLESLTLSGNITGPIPDAITNLVRLRKLELSGGFTGPIPASFGRLNTLTYLDLSSNRLTGLIPSTLGQLTSLSYLDLSNNKLSGSIPDSLGRLTGLDWLNLGSNRLNGPIPASLSQLSNISRLDLRANRLTGSIPSSFGSFVNNPKMWLFLSQNQLSGPVPRSLGQAKINLLDLSRNRLTGDISFLFGRSKTWLEILYLNNNHFKFDLSNVEFPLGLRYLLIQNNEIYGSLPKQLGQLPFVPNGLYVNNNRLCGRIPTGRRLKQMSPDAFAHNKCLCGVPLPPCKGKA